MAVWLRRRDCGLKLGELGELSGGLDYPTAGEIMKKGMKRLARDSGFQSHYETLGNTSDRNEDQAMELNVRDKRPDPADPSPPTCIPRPVICLMVAHHFAPCADFNSRSTKAGSPAFNVSRALPMRSWLLCAIS